MNIDNVNYKAIAEDLYNTQCISLGKIQTLESNLTIEREKIAKLLEVLNNAKKLIEEHHNANPFGYRYGRIKTYQDLYYRSLESISQHEKD